MTELSLVSIAEKLITTAIVAGITALIMVQVLKHQTRELSNGFRELTRTVLRHEQDIAAMSKDRVECELRSGRMYATRADIARLISDQTNQHQQVISKLDELSGAVHGRITRTETGLAELKGRAEGLEHGSSNNS